MTDDYKKILLDYITELEPGTPTTEERIYSIDEVAKEVWNPFLPTAWSDFIFKGALKSTTSDKVVFYGGYVDQGGTYSSNSKGIIIITDSDLNPIQTIFKYSSGTDLRPIECMIQEEDGQFVAMDSEVLYSNYTSSRQAYYTCERRFIMLNDISVPNENKYQVNLRRSFILGNDYKNFVCKDIYKNPSSSHYFMAGTKLDTSTTQYFPRYVKVIDLKVNVGSANEWSTSSTQNQYIYGGSYCYFDSSDNAQWKLLISANANSDNGIRYWYGTNGSATNSALIFTPSYKTYIDEETFECQSVFLNQNLVYFTTNNQQWGNSGTLRPKYVGLYEYNFTTGVLKEIFLKSLGNYDYSRLDIIQLYTVNGELYIEYCTNVDTTTNKADYYVQRYEGAWNPILIKEQSNYYMTRRAFYVAQTFNLLKIYCLSINPQALGFPLLETTEVYNQGNYNGEPYEDTNSLKGRYANIYSNGELVFSRNLHNLSYTNNYTVASVEIPNTYLNGLELNPKDLVGETNITLVEDGNTVSKNIYEVLYLNYINTINVIDNSNNMQPEASEWVNTNINEPTNYENARCGKIRINYNTLPVEEFPITWERIDDTHKFCEFTIHFKGVAESIDFISNDGEVVYQSIQTSLYAGEYMTFKQYLKVE